jgi:hypothetical protein
MLTGALQGEWGAARSGTIRAVLKDLTRGDWLSILGLAESRIPRALVLRGTRNLDHYARAYRERLADVVDLGAPNGIVEHVFIGRLRGRDVGFAAVYGAPMASEVTHIFGVLGTRLALQTGCCGALADGIACGDLVLPTAAFCGEGAAHYYAPGAERVAGSVDLRRFAAVRAAATPPHSGPIYTTAALFAEGRDDLERWAAVV